MNILRLKEILNEKGVTGKELAEKAGVTPASISNIVQGNSFPKPELLQKIAQILDIDIKDLFVSTKDKNTLYIEKEGKYIPIGEINTMPQQNSKRLLE